MAADTQVDIFKTTSTLSSVQMFVVVDILRNWDKALLFNMVTQHFSSHGGGPMLICQICTYTNALQLLNF